MIKLLQKHQFILSAYLEGKSYRSIAREIGISRKTVAKYVREYEKARILLLDTEGNKSDVGKLIDTIVEKPRYNSQNRNKRKLTSEISERFKKIFNAVRN